MDPLFKKMNFKNQSKVVVLQAPESFQPHMEAMMELTTVATELGKDKELEFIIAFVTQQAEIDQLAPGIVTQLKGDALVWFCYPKKSSKNYRCDFNRDTGWQILGDLGLEPVRMVAIDQDWSALRFRKVEFIKKITRRSSMALTKEAKKRTTNKK